MTEKAHKTLHVKWVRSGIAFTRHQKTMIRSLGLTRLNQVVERPDTAPIRGLVANLTHLVEIVQAPSRPAWMDVPEYTIHPPEAAPEKPAKPARKEKAEPKEEAPKAAPKETKAAVHHEKPAKAAKAKTPAKAKAKTAKSDDTKKHKAAEKTKASKKTKK